MSLSNSPAGHDPEGRVGAATARRTEVSHVARSLSHVLFQYPGGPQRVQLSVSSRHTAAFPNIRAGRRPHFTFEACSGFTRVTAVRLPASPQGLCPCRGLRRAGRYRVVPTPTQVDLSSTGPPRPRGAPNTAGMSFSTALAAGPRCVMPYTTGGRRRHRRKVGGRSWESRYSTPTRSTRPRAVPGYSAHVGSAPASPSALASTRPEGAHVHSQRAPASRVKNRALHPTRDSEPPRHHPPPVPWPHPRVRQREDYLTERCADRRPV